MITVNILYPWRQGARFDFDHYVNKHMPMTRQLVGKALLGMRIEKGIVGTEPGSPPTFTALCYLQFESIDSFMAAFMPVAAQLQGDMPNYTDIAPQIQFSEVLLG